MKTIRMLACLHVHKIIFLNYNPLFAQCMETIPIVGTWTRTRVARLMMIGYNGFYGAAAAAVASDVANDAASGPLPHTPTPPQHQTNEPPLPKWQVPYRKRLVGLLKFCGSHLWPSELVWHFEILPLISTQNPKRSDTDSRSDCPICPIFCTILPMANPYGPQLFAHTISKNHRNYGRQKHFPFVFGSQAIGIASHR